MSILTNVDGAGFEPVKLPYALAHGNKSDEVVGVAGLGLFLLLGPRCRAPGALLLLGLFDIIVQTQGRVEEVETSDVISSGTEILRRGELTWQKNCAPSGSKCCC